MTTTTLRLPDELKARLARLAEAKGTTSHALMVEMLAESARQCEEDAEFVAEAERRLARMARTGEYYTLDDVRSYAMALARGEKPAPPPLRKMSPEEHSALKAARRRRGAA